MNFYGNSSTLFVSGATGLLFNDVSFPKKKKNVYLIFFSDGMKNNTFSQKVKLTVL